VLQCFHALILIRERFFEFWCKFGKNFYMQVILRDAGIRKMTETTGQKKVVSRTIVIAIGIVCIVLVAGLVGTLAIYVPQVSSLKSQMAEKDNSISSLNSQVSSLTQQVASLHLQITSLQSNTYSASDVQNIIGNYTQQLSDNNAILTLSKSAYLVQGLQQTLAANSSTSIWSDNIIYAGYFAVQVTSNSSTTYARVIYALPVSGQNFDYNVTVGTSGTAVFPVLPGTVVFGIGNTELADAVNATVTAVYYY
jgi:cell division protein FtsB